VKQATYTRCVKPLALALARAHVGVHRASGGRIGRRWRGGDVALLSTMGRRTGRLRTTPLVCIRDGDDIVVVASNGGSDRTPDWWLNLQDSPRAEVVIHGRPVPVIAQPAPADRHAPLLERFSAVFPCLAGYRSRTDREMPVVILRPVVGAITSRRSPFPA
jgi:deazaflavin-dependent oxidoreductase (nitroreductase family)